LKAANEKSYLSFTTAIIIAVVLQINSFADSWGKPQEFDFFSQSGNVVAHIIPRKKDSRTSLAVYALQEGKRMRLWSMELCNLPIAGYVSDDGKHVITFDNWGTAGYGDDIAVIYNKSGLLKKYSFEELFQEPKPRETKEITEISAGMTYFQKKFSHSTSSRWWRENSYGFFDEKEPIFCLWINWDERWLAWNMETGKLHTVSAAQQKRWNDKCRTIMLDTIKNGKADILEYEFLGKMKNPKDKPLIQELLNDTDFRSSSISSFDNGMPKFTLCSESLRREVADKILAKRKNDPADTTYSRNYVFLGSAELAVTFPAPPKKGEGNLIVYLVEDGSGHHDFRSFIPKHYLFANLESYYPFDPKTMKDSQLDRTVNFSIKGITPGKYKVIAIWDRKKPFMEEKPPFIPAKGDFVSDDTVKIEINAGQTIKNVSVQCMNPIK